jgi:hypothetical protein
MQRRPGTLRGRKKCDRHLLLECSTSKYSNKTSIKFKPPNQCVLRHKSQLGTDFVYLKDLLVHASPTARHLTPHSAAVHPGPQTPAAARVVEPLPKNRIIEDSGKSLSTIFARTSQDDLELVVRAIIKVNPDKVLHKRFELRAKVDQSLDI